VVSHIISCGVPTAHESPAIGLCIAACATAEKPTRKKERIDRILYIGVLTDGCNIIGKALRVQMMETTVNRK
jgi:hypothetical protein